MQSLLVYWFHLRFGAAPEALGALFFGTNLLSALSFLAASRVAERFGLLHTMVFTHLPSNVLLLLVPFMPSVGSGRGRAARAPPALADGRADAAGVHDGARRARGARGRRGLHGQRARARRRPRRPSSPASTMAAAATPLPFLLAGGLKIVYDLLLFFRFRSVALPDAASP